MRIRTLSVLLLAACGGSSAPTRPATTRGLRADEHLDVAQQHARRAAGLARWLDARRAPDPQYVDRDGVWYRAWRMAREDEREMAFHRDEAARLHAEYDLACAGIPRAEIGVSPIERYGMGWLPKDDGAILLLSPAAGPAERLVAAMRCHRAWMMLEETGMQCTLDLAGLDVVAYGDRSGISVELSVDRALVPELQRRAKHELAHR